MPKILVVDDEPDVVELIEFNLKAAGFAVATADDGAEALRQARAQTPDLVVLDVMLPGMDWIEVCKQLRRENATARVPILMLTAKAAEIDRVLGLELGADDYLTKPFSVLELRARIKALLRRAAVVAPAASEPARIDAGGLSIDREQRRVHLDGRELTLTAREFELLWYFARHPGRVFTRSELLADVWGYGHDGYDHTVNSHINRLRNKLGDEREQARFIHTVWGVGYRFEVAA